MYYTSWYDLWAALQLYYPIYTHDINIARNNWQDAMAAGFTATGFNYLIGAVAYVCYAMEALLGDELDPFSNALSINAWYWAHQSALTMDTLLNTMLTADISQLTQFIGIEDAYRSAIWDQPFNAQFYAALAQGFRSQL